jgi:hypothetical protein
LQQATITVPYPAGTADPQQLRLFTYDPTHQMWAPSAPDAQQYVDTISRTVTATVNHFSIYAVFNIANWKSTYTAITSCTTTPDGPDVDVAFVMDSSGSMTSSDPENLRIAAAKEFVDALDGEDRGGVVDFDDVAIVLQSLTSNKAALKAALDQIDANGGTNIGAGVSTGLAMLRATPVPDQPQLMILLTDGVGAYDQAVTDEAVADKVTIDTIGLGAGTDEALLQRIAADTGGEYHRVATADDLPEVFRNLEGPITNRDYDNDGVEDCDEIDGMVDAATGELITSDPRRADTDGDGLPDGVEVGPRINLGDIEIFGQDLGDLVGQNAVVHVMLSDPRAWDTDGDDLSDAVDLEEGGYPRLSDSDDDGADDRLELEYNSDPLNRDTDADTLPDAYEIQRPELGLDPLEVDHLRKPEYARDFGAGVICGDFCDAHSFPWLVGQLGSGVFVYGDVRDFFAAISDEDWLGAGLNAFGVIPVVGDIVKSGSKISKFAAKAPGEVDEALAATAKIDLLTDAEKVAALKKLIGEARYARLRGAGISTDTLARLAAGRSNLGWLDDAVQAGVVRVGEPGVRFFKPEEGEQWLKTTYGGSGPKYFPTRAGVGGRFVDVFSSGAAHESKVGRMSARSSYKLQLEKDKELLLSSGSGVTSVTWHFFPSDITSKVGPTPGLVGALNSPPPPIPYVIHIPK